MNETLQSMANMATVLALIWAIYEFKYKKRTIAKANGWVPPSTKQLYIDVYNGSPNRSVVIDSICIEIKRWNSEAECYKLKRVAIHPYNSTEIVFDLSEAIDKLQKFAQKRSVIPIQTQIFLKTVSGEKIDVMVDDKHKLDISKLIKDGNV